MTETPTAVVARRMRALRQGRFTAEQLADAMTAQGIPWQRSIVANLENGRREAVSVDELFALALVLGVTPATLLVDVTAGAAQVAPDLDVLPAELLLWVAADAELPEPAPVTSNGPDVDAVRGLWRAWDQVRALGTSPTMSGSGPDLQRAMRDGAHRQLRERAAAVSRRGIRLPSVVAAYIATLPEDAP